MDSTNSWKYDVFLSFRGEDTRLNFTDHLHSSLLRGGINTFVDQVEKGQVISEEIFQAIEGSRISVIIFSENYASSTWCLEELAKILECRESRQQIVIPIFYGVKPADVRRQQGRFAEAFAHHENRFKENLEKVERWRAALTDAANLAGMDFNNYGRESIFIHEITELISQKLNRAYLTYETNYPVEIDSRIQEFNDRLGVGVADVRMVGICGTEGMGKTTLANAVYNSVAHRFEGSCFLENVRENSKAPGGLVQLQKILLHNILGLKMCRVSNVDSELNIIKGMLRYKRVLLILDDVDQRDQLKCLAGSSDWFGVGSRIIITTRVEHLLLAHRVDFTYQVKELESDEALDLFSSNAFPTSRLPADYEELASSFVRYAQGNPLALTAMGALLYGKNIDEWQSILESYKRAPASNIHEILKITKKELEHPVKRPKENVLPNVEEEHAGVHDLQSTGLNKAESNELMLEQNDIISGIPEVERLQGKISETYYEVTGQNEDENTENLVEGDKTFSSTQEEDLLQGKTPGTDDAYALKNMTTEPVASSSSPSTYPWKYDVFLSFKGEDTRVSFTDHLYSSLLRRGINTFMDDDQLERGQDTSRKICQAIKESRISIIIFSENYASSTWCLEELAKIIEYKNSQDQIVIPVYYNVDPADVRNQKGPFGAAFVRHECRFGDNLEKVQRWRAALKNAGDLAGMLLNRDGHESKFIHEITEMISQQLKRVYLTYKTNYPVEIDSRIREMNYLLGVGVPDVRMVGICGTGGMGKTTLAKAVYNSVAHKFEGSCFLENVRENSKAPGGLGRLQKILLHNILGLKMSRVTNVDSELNIIKGRLRYKRVLLILDDVDQLDQLKCLAGSSDWFGVGSRIIITTRVEHLLLAHRVYFIYQVKELESDEALELFSCNAFPTSRLPDDYLELASRVVGYAQGNPLALTAMGSLLYGKSIDEWHSILERYERPPASDIPEILKITKKEHDLQSTRLNEAESPEKLVEDEEDGVKATETNKGSPGGDETSPDTQKKDQLGDVTESEEPEEPDPADNDTTIESDPKGFSDSIFLITSLLYIFSAICNQFSSSEKPKFAVIGMVLDVLALFICVSELIYKGRKRKFEFGRGLFDLFRLICGISQCACSIVQCVCVLRRTDNPFPVILLPFISNIRLLIEYRSWSLGRAESPDSGERTMSLDRTPVSGLVEGGRVSVPSSSPSTNSWKYDVFLSFRGVDTRYSFTDHLHSSLLRRGINTFTDDLLEQGQVIHQAIKESRIFIIIFSENYASSTWCLEELAKIIEYMNPQQQIVIPVYYKVDPAHVRNQKGPFGAAFVEHENGFKDDLEKVSRWRAALAEAANFPGMNFNNYGRESKFIHEITEMILQKLNRAYLTYETSYPVGIDSRIREMNDLLGVGAADVGMVGIWGTGGMGKTTLAKAVYNSIAHKFEGSCFLENVRENSKAPGGLVQLQNSLLHNILGQTQKTWRVTNVGSGINVIKDSLRKKKVLLVLDDVNQLDQLKYLAGSSDWFGAGSRIVITSRDKHLLLAYGVLDFTYQVKELESDEALELFSCNAFPTSRLPDDYQELASSFVGYAQGNPLALTAMGSLLYGKSIEEWHSILERYRRAPASNIHEILKITKKELVHDLQSTRLKEAESPEKLVEDEEDGPNEVGSPEMPEDDESEADGVDGVNATESNKSSPGGDETSADTQKKERLIEQIIDVIESEEPEEPDPADNDTTIESDPKGFSDWIFLIISLILEIISAICDQFSSSEKPKFAVIGMVLAIVALVICVSELIYKGRKRKFEFGRCRMCLWWFFCPKTERLFGTLPDLFGLICGISLGASSIVQCVCVLRRKDNPFKVNLLPIIFLICVGGSKLFEDCKRCTDYSWPRSLGREIRAESQDSGERTTSLDRTPDSGSVDGGRVSGPSNLSTQLSFIRKRVGNSNDISGDRAFGSIGDENRLVAAEINGYPRSSQTTSTNLTC